MSRVRSRYSWHVQQRLRSATRCTEAGSRRASAARSRSRTARRSTKKTAEKNGERDRDPALLLVEAGRDELPQLIEDERRRDEDAGPQADRHVDPERLREAGVDQLRRAPVLAELDAVAVQEPSPMRSRCSARPRCRTAAARSHAKIVGGEVPADEERDHEARSPRCAGDRAAPRGAGGTACARPRARDVAFVVVAAFSHASASPRRRGPSPRSERVRVVRPRARGPGRRLDQRGEVRRRRGRRRRRDRAHPRVGR